MEIQRGKGIALWQQIARILEQDIARGAYKPGDRLPTEFQLAERFRVNRHTARRALAGLQEKGLVRVEQGRGTFVQEQIIHYSVSKRTRFSENLIRQKRTPAGELLGLETVPASAEAAAALFIDQDAPLVVVNLLRRADGRPVSLTDHCFPLPRFADLPEVVRATGSITEGLRACGVEDFVRVSTRITAAMPTPSEARLLEQPKNRPLLVTRSVNADPRGIPVEYGVARYASDWVQLVVDEHMVTGSAAAPSN